MDLDLASVRKKATPVTNHHDCSITYIYHLGGSTVNELQFTLHQIVIKIVIKTWLKQFN